MIRWPFAVFVGLLLGPSLWLALSAAAGTFWRDIDYEDYLLRKAPPNDAELQAWLDQQTELHYARAFRRGDRLRVICLVNRYDPDGEAGGPRPLYYVDVPDNLPRFGYDADRNGWGPGHRAPFMLLGFDPWEQLRLAAAFAAGVALACGARWLLDRRRARGRPVRTARLAGGSAPSTAGAEGGAAPEGPGGRRWAWLLHLGAGASVVALCLAVPVAVILWKGSEKEPARPPRLQWVAFSPDGKVLATAGGDNVVTLWDAQTLQERARLLGHTGQVYCVVFSPDGKTLASSSYDQTVRLWDAETGQERAALTGHGGPVYCVAFSPGGEALASGSNDKTVKLWDAKSGKELTALAGHTDAVMSVAFLPGGETLASGSTDTTVRLWDLRAGKELRTLGGHTGSVYSVAVSPDGKTLASGGSDKTIKLWDAGTGAERATLRGHSQYVVSVAFSPDGGTLASGDWGGFSVRLWDVKAGEEREPPPGYHIGLQHLTFGPDGKKLASASWKGTVKLWDVSPPR